MSMIEINTQTIGFPMPVAVLGTMYEGRPNFMTVAWLTRVNFKPPQIAVAVGHSHASAGAIQEHGAFGLSFPTTDQMVETDYVGIVSGARQDKSRVFPVFNGELEGAPMAANCPIAMECRLAESLALSTNTIYVGEIVKVWADEALVNDGAIDLGRTDPLLLTMPDNRYWSLGEPVGAAWSAGREYRP